MFFAKNIIKHLSLALTAGFIVFSFSATAAIEKPHFRAGLEIKKIQEKPEIYRNFKKILNLSKETQIDLSLIMNERNQSPQKMVLNLSGEKSEFRISEKSIGKCGDIVYQAEFTNNQPVDRLFGYQIHLTLTDHMKNNCRKVTDQKWEATLTLIKRVETKGVSKYENAGKILFAGNPVRIMRWN